MAKNEDDNEKGVNITPMRKRRITLTVRGTSPLIQHAWSEKAKEMMRQKHQGKKTKTREVRDIKKEGADAAYYMDDGRYAMPLMAFKSAIITAAHKDIGIEKTLVKKAVFMIPSDGSGNVPIDGEEPRVQEDMVRVGMGAADLRYRPYYYVWSCRLSMEIDSELITEKDLITLFDRAGFGVGIGEWRPQNGGEFGRFKIDRTETIESEKVE